MVKLENSNQQDRFRKKPDGDSEPAAEVGWYLQRERETLGYSLLDVAHELRVDPTYLHALEEGELHYQLGWTYVLSYVRSYSDFLGFEPGPVIQHYKKILAEQTGVSLKQRDENWPFTEVRARAAIATFAGIVGAMGLAGLALDNHHGEAENTPPQNPSHLSSQNGTSQDLQNKDIKKNEQKSRYNKVTENLLVQGDRAQDVPEIEIRNRPLSDVFDQKKSKQAALRLLDLSAARLASIAEN